jgi:hypothetical protein
MVRNLCGPIEFVEDIYSSRIDNEDFLSFFDGRSYLFVEQSELHLIHYIAKRLLTSESSGLRLRIRAGF